MTIEKSTQRGRDERMTAITRRGDTEFRHMNRAAWWALWAIWCFTRGHLDWGNEAMEKMR